MKRLMVFAITLHDVMGARNPSLVTDMEYVMSPVPSLHHHECIMTLALFGYVMTIVALTEYVMFPGEHLEGRVGGNESTFECSGGWCYF